MFASLFLFPISYQLWLVCTPLAAEKIRSWKMKLGRRLHHRFQCCSHCHSTDMGPTLVHHVGHVAEHGMMMLRLLTPVFENAAIYIVILVQQTLIIIRHPIWNDGGRRVWWHEASVTAAVMRHRRRDATFAVGGWRGGGVTLETIAALRRFGVTGTGAIDAAADQWRRVIITRLTNHER